MLRRLGKRREAAATLSDARVRFAALQNPLWLARVDAEERRLGGRRRADGALTPTEARVAELAGQGLRNAEIAARLYISTKTAGNHVSNILAKLHLRSRQEAAAYAVRNAIGDSSGISPDR